MAQNVVDVEKNGSYLQVITSKLHELMCTKANPGQASPTHYTSLKWVVAFGGAFFDANIEWVKRHDPIFGAGSCGHISLLVLEHLIVMHKQFEALKNDGWKKMPELNDFVRAVDGVAEMKNVNKGGKEFFECLPNLFFERSEESFKEHKRKWRTKETLPIIIAGHPLVAKAFIPLLFGYEKSFPDEEIELKQHYLDGQPTKINIGECLTWLINGAFKSLSDQTDDPTEALKAAMMKTLLLKN
jgi:hypothetical protein